MRGRAHGLRLSDARGRIRRRAVRSGAHNVFTPILEFFREYNQRYYTGTDNVADVAVLRNWPSMAYSINSAYVPATLMEQVLIQYKIPFDLLFEEQLDRIGRYGAVILAGQECVSNDQAETLLQYVRGGGTLVLAGNAGQYNQWRERRHKIPCSRHGTKARAASVYIPEIIRADSRLPERRPTTRTPSRGAHLTRSQRMSPAQWVLPKNHRDIYQAVVDALPKGLSITTEAPLTTVMELSIGPHSRNHRAFHQLRPPKQT